MHFFFPLSVSFHPPRQIRVSIVQTKVKNHMIVFLFVFALFSLRWGCCLVRRLSLTSLGPSRSPSLTFSQSTNSWTGVVLAGTVRLWRINRSGRPLCGRIPSFSSFNCCFCCRCLLLVMEMMMMMVSFPISICCCRVRQRHSTASEEKKKRKEKTQKRWINEWMNEGMKEWLDEGWENEWTIGWIDWVGNEFPTHRQGREETPDCSRTIEILQWDSELLRKEIRDQ